MGVVSLLTLLIVVLIVTVVIWFRKYQKEKILKKWYEREQYSIDDLLGDDHGIRPIKH